MRALVALLFVLLSGCASTGERAQSAAWADIGSTAGALALGAVETNPLGLLTIPLKYVMLELMTAAEVAAIRDKPVVPAAVTMRQARLALLGAGALAGVDAAINAMPEPTRSAAKIEWEYSQEVQRHNGFVAALGPALGMTNEQIDALFIAAAKL